MDQKFMFSLLWPDYFEGKKMEERIRSGEGKLYNQDFLERDMNVEMLLEGMGVKNESRPYVKARLMDMVLDEKIIKYRQDILQDFLDYPEIQQAFDQELMPLVINLNKMQKTNISHDDDIRKIAWRLEILRVYTQCVTILHRVFCSKDRDFTSEGLQRLQSIISSIVENEGYNELLRLLPDLHEKLQTMSGVTLGINLDHELRPTEAVLLSIEPKPFRNKALLTSIFGTRRNDELYHGIGTFYSILKDTTANALDQAIMRDLAYVMEDTFRHMAMVLNRFAWVETAFIFDLVPEVYYYIGGSNLARNLLEGGMPVCFPTPMPAEERVFIVKDLYDASFAIRILSDTGIKALHNIIVTNDARMCDDPGRLLILTGANQGGKTTFTRAVGIAQILFQAGLPIPGTEGKISPVDNIYTHFPELEKNSISEGRLGEECVRLEGILPRLTKYSMILMNESLSSTSHQESLTIAEEIMKYLRTIGARGVFATHMHELAEDLDEINKQPALSNLVSLVAGVDETKQMEVMTEEGIKTFRGSKRTYKIVESPPQGRSFALDIARTYGITFEQLLDSHKNRHELGVEEETPLPRRIV